MREKDSLVYKLRREWESFVRELPSAQQVIIFVMLAMALAGYAQWQEDRRIAREHQCPGEMNIAPQEVIHFMNGSESYTVANTGPNWNGTGIAYSKGDNDFVTIFGNTLNIDQNESITVGGIDFRNRATRDQTTTGNILTFVGGSDNCVLIETGQ